MLRRTSTSDELVVFHHVFMAAIPSTVLIRAIKKDDLKAINKRLQRISSALDNAIDTSFLTRIIEWANDHKLPEFRPFDAVFYKERGVLNIRQLRNLRYLLVTDDHGTLRFPKRLHNCCFRDYARQTTVPVPFPRFPPQLSVVAATGFEDNDITRIEDGIHALRNVYGIDPWR